MMSEVFRYIAFSRLLAKVISTFEGMLIVVMEMSNIKISVIIPSYGRSQLLDRAISSVLACDGAENVEIIVVDDCSPEHVTSNHLREQDRVLRLALNSGAAVARNVGIRAASGNVIKLLDSDDYLLKCNFNEVYDLVSGSGNLWYSDINSQGYRSNYPGALTEIDFFDCILNKYPHICQTSSLFFDKDIGIMFDEKLPKHQDWDFVHTYLTNYSTAKKIPGRVYFDRSDQFSISRKVAPEKSILWFEKIRSSNGVDAGYLHYYLFCLSGNDYSFFSFINSGLYYVVTGRLSLDKFLRFGYRRLFSV